MTETLWTTGRRKTSIARVRIVPGEGRVKINGKTVEEYFGGSQRQKSAVMAPFKVAPLLEKYDIFVNAHGGGITGQADAIRLGLARAMVELDDKTKGPLRTKGYLTRDPRAVERKKYGQPKARRRYQHSKR